MQTAIVVCQAEATIGAVRGAVLLSRGHLLLLLRCRHQLLLLRGRHRLLLGYHHRLLLGFRHRLLLLRLVRRNGLGGAWRESIVFNGL